MEASSRAALAAVRERLDELTRPASGVLAKTKDRLTGQHRAATGPELLSLADELFAVARLLHGQLALRRALSDPSVKPVDRARLAQRVFGSKVSATTLDLIEAVARQRWSHPIDLVDAFTTLAIEASLDAADVRGELDGVEDELFRFGRIVGGDRELARILGDRKAPAEGRRALLDRLLSGRVSPVTEQLLRYVLTGSYAGSAEVAIERLSDAASRRRGQSVARVTTAVALTPTQEQRLTDVLGGLIVQVGDEVIDGSIAHRLEAAERRLAG